MIQLSKYYWFRNNDVMKLIEDDWITGTFAKKVSEEDRKNLKLLVDELDNLKDGSKFEGLGFVELKDATSNKDYAAVYLNAIYQIMEKYSVPMRMYRNLGKCFEEMEIKPPEDIAKVVQYVTFQPRRRSGDHICWSSKKKC